MVPSPSRFFHGSLCKAFVLCTILLTLLGCDPTSDSLSPPGQSSSSPSRSHTSPDGTKQGLDQSTEGQTSLSRDAARIDWPRIVAFGNSLTAGFGVGPDQTYPARLQRRLDEAGYRIRVINAGVSGETSAGGLRRVDWVLKSQPRLVILELGANDGLRGLNPAQTRANLAQIIQRFQSAGVPVVLAGMKVPPNYGEEFTARFAAIYPELARTYQLPFLPFFLDGVATRQGLNQADGIHPTGEGYQIIVDHLMPVLEPLLAEISAKHASAPHHPSAQLPVRTPSILHPDGLWAARYTV